MSVNTENMNHASEQSENEEYNVGKILNTPEVVEENQSKSRASQWVNLESHQVASPTDKWFIGQIDSNGRFSY